MSAIDEVVRRLANDRGEQIRSVQPRSRIRRPSSDVTILDLELRRSTRKIVVKQFRPKDDSATVREKLERRVRKEFDTTRLFHEKFAGLSGFSTAEPIGCYPELLSIAMVYSPGENLGDLVDRKARFYPGKAVMESLSAAARACGGYLVRLQEMTAEPGTLDLEALIEDIDLRLRKMVDLGDGVMDPSLRREVLDLAARQASLAKDTDLGLCGVHGDYCTSNILIDRDEVTVLDFTMFKSGSTFHDATYFCRNLANFLHKPVFRPRTIAALQRAFLDGYDGTVDTSGPMFRLLSLRHVVCHLLGVVQAKAPLHGRLFNRRVIRRHLAWIRHAVNDAHDHALV